VALVVGVSLAFLLIDSRFHILFFHEKPGIEAVVNCKVVDLLDVLDGDLKSEDGKKISITIDKLILQLNIAYGFETKFSILTRNSEKSTTSKLSESIKDVRLNFDRYERMSDQEILKSLDQIEQSRLSAQKRLNNLC
jgi:hypothetical protein